jgi:hypothetical protein
MVVVVEVVVEGVVEEVEGVEEAVAEEVEDNPRLSKSSSLAKMKGSWDNSHKYSTGIAPKPKLSWRKSKDTSASIPMLMD